MDNKLLKAVEKAVNLRIPFCAYRLPGKENIVFGAEMKQSDSKCLFKFNAIPFDVKSEESITVKCNITDPDKFINSNIEQTEFLYNIENKSQEKTQYIKSIQNVIDNIKSGDCKKIVYSNTDFSHHNKTAGDWAKDFISLCNAYPNAFVFIFKSNTSNFWMGATPEIILCNDHGIGETMSLAGTRKADTAGQWGEKEQTEQKIVTNYITHTIESNNLKYQISETFTKNAGNIEHLCNKFSIEIDTPENGNKLLSQLHPTPAISGYPKERTINYLKNNEPHNRKFYGGYCGPQFDENNFNYYVILRCIEFNADSYCLYAGGGITRDSNPENEWTEIMNKFMTLKKIIGNI